MSSAPQKNRARQSRSFLKKGFALSLFGLIAFSATGWGNCLHSPLTDFHNVIDASWKTNQVTGQLQRPYLDPKVVEDYSKSTQVTRMLGYLIRNKKNHIPTNFQCYKYVKPGVYAGHLAPYGTITGSQARMGFPKLKSQGFINLLDFQNYHYLADRQHANAIPKGAIIVTELNPEVKTRNSDWIAGDIQVRTGAFRYRGHYYDGFVSDYYTPHALVNQADRQGRLMGDYFHITAILIKPLGADKTLVPRDTGGSYTDL